jgi:hypothetical protein
MVDDLQTQATFTIVRKRSLRDTGAFTVVFSSPRKDSENAAVLLKPSEMLPNLTTEFVQTKPSVGNRVS